VKFVFFKVRAHTSARDIHSRNNYIVDKLAVQGTTMGFKFLWGKYKGKKLKDTPRNYLKWIVENDDYQNTDIKIVISEFLKN